MLPCYYALAALALRYHSIMKEPPELNVPEIPAEGCVTCLESQSQTVPGMECDEPPASYSIKSKLSVLNSCFYLFMGVFTIIGTPDMFYACNHKPYGVVYLLGAAAWFLVAIVLRREHQRKLTQSLWTHRIFWVFSAAFAITKMFEDYLLPFNFVLNVLFIVSTPALTQAMSYWLSTPFTAPKTMTPSIWSIMKTSLASLSSSSSIWR